MRGESTPKPCEAARASPESFSRTRLKIGSGMSPSDSIPQTKKGHLFGALELLRLLFRLRNGDRLAGVADLKSRKSPDRDVLAQLADFGRDQLRDGLRLVLDKGLLVQADLFVELFHLAGNHLFGNVRRLAAGHRLRKINVFLAVEVCLGNVFFADKLRVGGRDVHGDVVYQLFEVIGPGDKIALAIDFDQHADFASGMNVLRN